MKRRASKTSGTSGSAKAISRATATPPHSIQALEVQMPSRPTSKALAEDFLRWRAKHYRQHRPVKRSPTSWWDRMAAANAAQASPIAIYIAANLGGHNA